MTSKTINFRDFHIEQLRDPEDARLYLAVALEEYEKDNDAEAFLLALRDVATAQGGLGKLAKKSKLNREHLYKMLSGKGNPRLNTLGPILHAMGFKLSIEPMASEK